MHINYYLLYLYIYIIIYLYCFILGVAPVGWLFDLSVNILQYGDLLINLHIDPFNPPPPHKVNPICSLLFYSAHVDGSNKAYTRTT